MKAQPMKESELQSHGQALYSLLLKPVVNTSPQWKSASNSIQQLAHCLTSYSQHLKDQLLTTASNQAQQHPVRTIGEHATLEHKCSGVTIRPKYTLIAAALKDAGQMSPVFFDESVHVEQPFDNAAQKCRFFSELQMTVPVDMIRFCPGGSQTTTVCFFQVSEGRNESVILTQGARFLQQISSQLKEFHTRAQRAEFKSKLDHIAQVSPATRRFIYQTLTNDSSVLGNAVMDERIRLISLGNSEIIDDLRHLNAGRPHVFDNFFQKLSDVVEEVTAADERRHNLCHLSQWMSLKEMIAQASSRCEKDDLVPSASLVRLQFAPRNPYTQQALNFTSRINVQYKIQRRQLRVSHPDDHYCAAMLKYLKEKAVELKDVAEVMFCDDKAKVPLGEPDIPVSTGVRGKSTLAPASTTLVALDHDMTKASVTPSVYLKCLVPECATESFVQGEVTTVVNDSVFESSSPFRHAVNLTKIAAKEQKKILLQFSDGGTDQRNTLEAVKCANICIFRELDLDMLVHGRCAPGHSWTNPAERIMAILNIGLQNCALERNKGDEESERKFKRCNSMADLRSAAEKDASLMIKWKESVEQAQSVVRNRFLRLKLKDQPMQALDPASAEEIDLLKRHLRELFPGMDLAKLQKVHTHKVVEYNNWLEKHARQRHYCFQLRKCDDRSCCSQPQNDDLTWLPDPVLDETGEHFMHYSDVKSMVTTEKDRPSFKVDNVTKPKRKRPAAVTTEATAFQDDARPIESSDTDHGSCEFTYTAQNARAVVNCIECRKPRVIYSKLKLSQRHQLSLTIAISECQFTCGAPILPPRHSLTRSVFIREYMGCASPIETPYYSNAMLGRIDLCAYCANQDVLCDVELKKRFKTVLPLCEDCKKDGKVVITYRPYGKQKNDTV